MTETSDYTDLDLYNQSPATVGKQNQIITAISAGGSEGSASIRSAIISCGASATEPIVDITLEADYISGSYIRVIGWYVTAGTATGRYLLSSGGTAMTGNMYVGVNGGAEVSKQFNCAADEDLSITTTTCSIEGIINYVLVAP